MSFHESNSTLASEWPWRVTHINVWQCCFMRVVPCRPLMVLFRVISCGSFNVGYWPILTVYFTRNISQWSQHCFTSWALFHASWTVRRIHFLDFLALWNNHYITCTRRIKLVKHSLILIPMMGIIFICPLIHPTHISTKRFLYSQSSTLQVSLTYNRLYLHLEDVY